MAGRGVVGLVDNRVTTDGAVGGLKGESSGKVGSCCTGFLDVVGVVCSVEVEVSVVVLIVDVLVVLPRISTNSCEGSSTVGVVTVATTVDGETKFTSVICSIMVLIKVRSPDS